MNRQAAPRGMLRVFLRFPVLLYRFGFGWLLGDSFVLLTHTGRNSGKPRRVVLEIVRLDRATQTVYILSGWGERSDWVRNLQRDPNVVIQVASRRWPATAERLDAAQAEQELREYVRRHPQVLAALAKRHRLGEEPATTVEETCRRLAGQIPFFALRPRKM
jgi:deazaflavin-dependent oxidoreductase (nitroreductase family)